MANYTAAGDVVATSSVRAGSNPASFTLPVAATTGAIAGTVVDLGAIYGTPTMSLVGGTGTGTIGLDGSMDGVNFSSTTAIAQTAASANTQIITATVGARPCRFLRINVSVGVAVAPITVIYGAF